MISRPQAPKPQAQDAPVEHDDTEAVAEPKEDEREEKTGSEDVAAEEETSEEPSSPEPKKTEKKAPSSDPLNPILYYSVVSQPKPRQKEEAKAAVEAEPTAQEEEEGEEEPKAEVDSTVSSTTTPEEPAMTASASEDSAEEPKKTEKKAPSSDPQNPLLYYSVVSQPKPRQKEEAKTEPTVQEEEEEPKAEVDSTTSSSTVSEEPAKASVSEDSTGSERVSTESKPSVTFEWRHGGSEVLVAGSFNGWTDKISLESNGEGVFSKTLELPPGDFEFKFVVDGDWKLNPDLPTQTDASGITNNVVHVSSSRSSAPSFQPLAQENGHAEDARWHPLAKRQSSILDRLKALERRVDLIAGQV